MTGQIYLKLVNSKVVLYSKAKEESLVYPFKIHILQKVGNLKIIHFASNYFIENYVGKDLYFVLDDKDKLETYKYYKLYVKWSNLNGIIKPQINNIIVQITYDEFKIKDITYDKLQLSPKQFASKISISKTY